MSNLRLPLSLLLVLGLNSTTFSQKIYVKDPESNEIYGRANGNVLIANVSSAKTFIPTDEGEIEETDEDVAYSDGFTLSILDGDENSERIEISLRSSNGKYLYMDGSSGEVSLNNSESGFIAIPERKDQAGNYKLYHPDNRRYLTLGTGDLMGSSSSESSAVLIAFVSAPAAATVSRYNYRMDSEDAGVVFLKSHVSKWTSAKRMECPSGSKYDAIYGGTCWTCPPGYERSIFAVNGNTACHRPARSEFLSAKDRGKGTGLFGTDCPSGAKLDLNGYCYSCPNGSVRTVYPVTGSQACEKVIPEAWKPADKVLDLNCTGNKFTDPSYPNVCWECPTGYSRAAFTRVDRDNACIKN